MKQITVYQASDGSTHATEEECALHEDKLLAKRVASLYEQTIPADLGKRARTARLNAALDVLAWATDNGFLVDALATSNEPTEEHVEKPKGGK